MDYTVTIFEQEEESLNIIKNYFEDIAGYTVKNYFTDYQDGYSKIQADLPDVLIINITSEEALSYVKKLSESGCKVIALNSKWTTGKAIRTMRAGAADFISIPVIKNELAEALQKLAQTEITSDTKNRVLTVFSNKGGIGKTAIAVNLAVELAKITKEKVALLDLNLQLGDVSAFLDIKPTFDISYVLNSNLEKDEDFILKTFEKYKNLELYILAEPAFAENAKDIKPKQISMLLNSLRKIFSYIIIDMSSAIDEKSATILDNSDLILFPTIINIPAIRNCQRCMEWFGRMGYNDNKTKILVNRYVENDEINITDFETALGREVYWKIPNNYFTIMSAINKGVPVSEINEDSNITCSLRDLAIKISDSIIEQNITERVNSKTV